MKIDLALATVVAAASCGYQFRTDRAGVPARVVFVPLFGNMTNEPAVEVPFTESLREQVARSRAFRLGARANADATFRGRVLRFGTTPIAFPGSSAGVRIGAYRATATVEVELVGRDGATLWRRGPLSGEGEYLTGTSVLATEANRARATRQIAYELMREVRDDLMRSK